MQPPLIRKGNSETGSVLIAVIAFVLLASVFLSLGLDFLKLNSPEDDRRRAIADINFLTSEIASYVQKNNRIPCPANPGLEETASDFGMEARGSGTSCTIREGIIPVRALFLPEHYAKDPWGRYYTYAISPAYADVNASSRVHGNCRTAEWVYPHSFGNRNVNPGKAQFCCPDISSYPSSSDLNLFTNGEPTYNTRSTNSGEFAAPDIPGAGVHQESAAIVIISHGGNGRGPGNLAAEEAENLDGDTSFAKSVTSNAPGGYFDDIVVFKSQYELMAQLNDGSCTRPFFSYTPEMLKEKSDM